MDITNYTTEHKKGQHLLSEERHEIEVRLKDGWSIYRIAKHLERPYNTIKNEIKRGTVSLYNGKVQRYKADEGKKVYLEHRQNCRKQYRCLAAVRFLQYVVDRFKSADKWSLDASCGEAMRNGTFPRSEMVCTKTLYNYVDGGLFDIRNIDLPRKVKYRPRYKKPELKVDRGCRVGRNYHDYEVYMEQHPDTAVVQMDSVIGSKGGKVLLTIYFVNVSLMLGFLREANTSKSVIDIYDELYHRLGGQDFRKLFPVILTDNGSEFSNPKCIENGPDGKGFRR